MNLLQRLLSPLFHISSTLIIIMVGVISSYAADLVDIRVGEYDDHTRIVFEFSDQTPIERIVPQEPGRLTMVFADVQPRLARKVPIKNSRRVQNIKIWHRKESLSLVLNFDFDHFRYELTEYKNPVRIALDVYALSSTSPQQPLSSDNQLSDAATPGSLATTDQLPVLPDGAASEREPISAEGTEPPQSENETTVVADDSSSTLSPSPAQGPEPVVPVTPPRQSEEKDIPLAAANGFSGLQFFLVIGLVTITIVILVLLLLMLLSKQRWTDDDTTLNTNASLKKQDERIAALNAKVHEQLKRYDEA